MRYSAMNPVGGITFRANSAVNVYGSYGKGCETPTLNDWGYRSVDGSLPGLKLGLKPARSDNFEVGIKAAAQHVRGDLAAFYIKSKDELSVQQNIGYTKRRGMDLGLDADWAGGFRARVAPCRPTIKLWRWEATSPLCRSILCLPARL